MSEPAATEPAPQPEQPPTQQQSPPQTESPPSSTAAATTPAAEPAMDEMAEFALGDGSVHKAHAALLKERCPLLYGMHRARTSQSPVGLPDVQASVMTGLLEFLYTGKIEALDAAQAVGLMNVARLLDVRALGQHCLQRLSEELLTPRTAAAVWVATRSLCLDVPAAMALGYVAHYASQCLPLTPEDVLGTIPFSLLSELLRLPWVAAAEDQVFAFVCRWIRLTSPDPRSLDATLAMVDWHRLTGPALVATAKPWLASSGTMARYVSVLESMAMPDIKAPPLPLRWHGPFAVGNARGRYGGYRLLGDLEITRALPALCEQYAAEGGVLPLLEMFRMTDPAVAIAGGVLGTRDSWGTASRVVITKAVVHDVQPAEPPAAASAPTPPIACAGPADVSTSTTTNSSSTPSPCPPPAAPSSPSATAEQAPSSVTTPSSRGAGCVRLSCGGKEPGQWPTNPDAWFVDAEMTRLHPDRPALFCFSTWTW